MAEVDVPSSCCCEQDEPPQEEAVDYSTWSIRMLKSELSARDPHACKGLCEKCEFVEALKQSDVQLAAAAVQVGTCGSCFAVGPRECQHGPRLQALTTVPDAYRPPPKKP